MLVCTYKRPDRHWLRIVRPDTTVTQVCMEHHSPLWYAISAHKSLFEISCVRCVSWAVMPCLRIDGFQRSSIELVLHFRQSL